MLPHDVWYHYYDEPCPFCGENIEMRNEGSWTHCSICTRIMCEECRFNNTETTCHVCEEKFERNENFDSPDVCEECMEGCEDCDDVIFHPSCAAEHGKTCSKEGRAERAVARATKDVENTEEEIEQLKRKLAEQEQELKAAKKQKTRAEKKLAAARKSYT